MVRGLAMSNLKKDIDEIVFRCFAQGQYWGTEADGKLDPGYKPEKPIDRTQAVNNILNLIESVVDEIIGEDEPKEIVWRYRWDGMNFRIHQRNELRKEQRAIKSKLIGGTK